MFGDNNQQQDSQASAGSMPQDASGTNSFGFPMTPASSMPAANDMVGGPAPASDDGAAMPPADELAAANDTTMTGRDMHAQTPDELMSIKQDALQSLKPLVGHLDQSPEERFRTI